MSTLLADLEPLADQLRRGPLPVAERELAGILLRIGDELRHGVGRDRFLDHRHPMPEDGVRDRHEILLRIVAGIFVHRRRRPPCSRVEQQRVAVRLRGRRGLGAGIGAGAGTVVDDDVLAEPRRELLRQEPRHHVVGRARRERHDHPDRLGGIGLRRGRGRGRRERRRNEGCGMTMRVNDIMANAPADWPHLVAFERPFQAAKKPRRAAWPRSRRRSHNPGLVACRSAVA